MVGKISLWILIIFFVTAGVLHFINASAYYPLIPDYLPFPVFINYASGTLEVLLGLSMLPLALRSLAGWGLIILMIIFIPSHVYFIQQGGCVENSLCFPVWVAWVRLIMVHPLLIWWIWTAKKFTGRVI